MPDLITQGPDGALQVTDQPIIPFIEGDGTGVDIWPAAKLVLDAAAAKYGKSVAWKEVLAGQKAFDETGDWLPDETVETFRTHLIGIKGPLTTPVGGGHPLAQRGPPPDPRPLRLPPSGAVVHRRALTGAPPRAGRHGHLPGEHRGHLRRPRGRGLHARGGQAVGVPARRDGLGGPRGLGHRHQADLRVRVQAAHPGRHQVRPRQRPVQREPGPQGEHPEVHRGRLPQLGLRAGPRGVRRRGRGLGRLRRQARRQAAGQGQHRRHHPAAGAHPARRSSTSSPPPTSTATTSPTRWPPRSAGSASRRAATSTTSPATASSRPPTARRPSTPGWTRSTRVR